jgi:hypothetical protein
MTNVFVHLICIPSTSHGHFEWFELCVTDQVLGYWTLLNLDLHYWDDRGLNIFRAALHF